MNIIPLALIYIVAAVLYFLQEKVLVNTVPSMYKPGKILSTVR